MEARGNALLAKASGHLLLGVGIVLALTALSTLLYASAAWAETIIVATTSDEGAGSLREAIEEANATVGADEIAFADGATGTITLSSQLPTVTDAAGLAIDGGEDVRVSGNHAVRAFEVGEGASLNLNNLTVADGHSDSGAGIYVAGGALELNNSTVSGNIAEGQGGGIYNDFGATVKVTDSTVSNNTAQRIPGNPDGAFGGGLHNGSGTVEVVNSTLSDNAATGSGGAVSSCLCDGEFWDVVLIVTNSTIVGNTAEGVGGAIFNGLRGTATINNSTIAGNAAAGPGGAIYHADYAPMSLSKTIVANNRGEGNCHTDFADYLIDGGYNVEDGSSCGFSEANGSL